MQKLSPLFTDKMNHLFLDICNTLEYLPPEQMEYLFGTGPSRDMDYFFGIASYITFEFIKYSFDTSDSEHSLRHYYKDINNPEHPLGYFFSSIEDSESERKRQERTMKNIIERKEQEFKKRGQNMPENYRFAKSGMCEIEQRTDGYHITAMNFFENQHIRDLAIIKAFANHRLMSTKKVSNEEFDEMFSEYDKLVEQLIRCSTQSDADLVFCSLALFTLEWHFPFETFYYIARLMEDNNITDVNQDDLILICGDVHIESIFGGSVKTHSRMVKERFAVIDYLFRKDINPANQELLRSMIKEYIVLGAKFKEMPTDDNKAPYKEWFRQESTIADWASFLRYYNIFDIWEKKEWTNKRRKNMRKLIELATIESK